MRLRCSDNPNQSLAKLFLPVSDSRLQKDKTVPPRSAPHRRQTKVFTVTDNQPVRFDYAADQMVVAWWARCDLYRGVVQFSRTLSELISATVSHSPQMAPR